MNNMDNYKIDLPKGIHEEFNLEDNAYEVINYYINRDVDKGFYIPKYPKLQKDINKILYNIKENKENIIDLIEYFCSDRYNKNHYKSYVIARHYLSYQLHLLLIDNSVENIDLLCKFIDFTTLYLFEEYGIKSIPIKGKLVVIEGCDGIGKDWIIDNLTVKNKCYVTREPGGTNIGSEIRELLLHSGNSMSMVTEILLFAASRAQFIEEIIIPTLQAGINIISNRFYYSSIIYQSIRCGIEGLSIEDRDIAMINEYALNNIRPDLTISLYTDNIDLINKRLEERNKDRMESSTNFKLINSAYKNLRTLIEDSLTIEKGFKNNIVSIGVDDEYYLSVIEGLIRKEIER